MERLGRSSACAFPTQCDTFPESIIPLKKKFLNISTHQHASAKKFTIVSSALFIFIMIIFIRLIFFQVFSAKDYIAGVIAQRVGHFPCIGPTWV